MVHLQSDYGDYSRPELNAETFVAWQGSNGTFVGQVQQELYILNCDIQHHDHGLDTYVHITRTFHLVSDRLFGIHFIITKSGPLIKSRD